MTKRNTKLARCCLQFYWFCCFWRHGSIAIFWQIFEQLRVVFHLHESAPHRTWRLSRYRWKKLSQSIRVEIYHPKCNHCNQLSREFPAIPTRHHQASRCRRNIPYSPRLQTQLFWAIHSFFAGVASWRSRVEYAISDACSNAVYTSNEIKLKRFLRCHYIYTLSNTYTVCTSTSRDTNSPRWKCATVATVAFVTLSLLQLNQTATNDALGECDV